MLEAFKKKKKEPEKATILKNPRNWHYNKPRVVHVFVDGGKWNKENHNHLLKTDIYLYTGNMYKLTRKIPQKSMLLALKPKKTCNRHLFSAIF